MHALVIKKRTLDFEKRIGPIAALKVAQYCFDTWFDTGAQK